MMGQESSGIGQTSPVEANNRWLQLQQLHRPQTIIRSQLPVSKEQTMLT